jgi:intracellular multiplication protein IcmT
MDIHWRNTQRPVRFFSLDARSAIFILLFMVHISMWTGILAVAMMLVFWALERMGLTFSSALRAFRSFILGPLRPANHRRAVRYWIDFG